MIPLLEYPIKKEIQIQNYRVILIHKDYIPKSSLDKNRNVLCLDEKDNLIWQIEELMFYGPRYPFIDIEYKNGELTLYNFRSVICTVDYKTGEILTQRETR